MERLSHCSSMQHTVYVASIPLLVFANLHLAAFTKVGGWRGEGGAKAGLASRGRPSPAFALVPFFLSKSAYAFWRYLAIKHSLDNEPMQCIGHRP